MTAIGAGLARTRAPDAAVLPVVPTPAVPDMRIAYQRDQHRGRVRTLCRRTREWPILVPNVIDREHAVATADQPAGPPALRCPSCGAGLGTELPARCASCTVPVGGDTGRQLLTIDQRIATLAAQRTELLTRLCREAAATPGVLPSPPAAPAASDRPASNPPPSGGQDAGPVRRWLAAAGPQTLLAAGGVLLLATAAVVFTAVAWRDLPMLGRAGVLLAAAGGSGRLTAALVRRELRRTAEATGVLTIILLAVLCNGLWAGGLLDVVGRGVAVLTLSAAVLAATSHVLARGTGVRSPLVLAAWLAGIAAHAAGVWLTDPYAAVGVDELDLLVLLAVDLVAALLAGGYAVRFLSLVPRWRVATLVGAGALWLGTAVGAPIILVALAPGTPADVIPFGVGAVVVVATVVLAAAARRIVGPMASWWPAVGTSAMWFAATLGVAGALSNRLGVWPEMAEVVALTTGAVALTRCRTASLRLSALVGMTPVALAAVVPVGRTAGWVLEVLEGTETAGPDVVRLASVVIVTAVAVGLALVVERARPLLVGGAGMSWLVAVVAAGVGAGVLAPSDSSQVPVFLVHAVLLAVLAGLAVRPALAPRPVAAGALSFAVTVGATGLLWERLASWPQLPVVVALAIGAVLVRQHARAPDRFGALVGLAPVIVAAAAVIATVVVWIDAVLGNRVGAPWPPAPSTVAVPGAAALASAAAVCAIAVGLAVVVHRTGVAAVLLTAVGGPVLLAVGAAVWPLGGAAVAGLVVVAGAVAGVRAMPEHPGPLVLAAAASAGTVVAALTAPWVTIATLAVAAAVTAVALPVRAPHSATTVAWLLTADVIGLAATVAAASDRDPGPVGMTLVAVAAVGWLVAAAVRNRRHHAIGVEVAAAVAFAIGVALTGARGGVWLGTAFAVLATAAAAVAVWRPDRRWMQWVAAASASASSWSILADAGVETVEAYTAPPALVLVGLAVLRLRARPDVSSWPILGSGVSLLTLPTVLQLTGDPGDLARLAVAVVLGAVLVVAGRTWALQSPLVIGVTVCAVAALTQHAVVTEVLPRWLLLAAGGAVLLWLSISYEAQSRRLAVARRRLVAMR